MRVFLDLLDTDNWVLHASVYWAVCYYWAEVLL